MVSACPPLPAGNSCTVPVMRSHCPGRTVCSGPSSTNSASEVAASPSPRSCTNTPPSPARKSAVTAPSTLLVLDPAGTLMGILTANDILGEKPMRFAHENHLKREEVLVRHVMTPLRGSIPMLFDAVLHAKVGNVVATLLECGRHHLLVAEQRRRPRQ